MVLWGLFTLTSLILLILILPYRLAVAGHIQWLEEKKTGKTQIHFGGAKRGISITPFPKIKIGIGQYVNPLFSFSLPQKKEEKPKKVKKTKKKRKFSISYIRIGRSALGEIHFDQFYLNGNLGLPNPMHTGIIYGWSQSLGNLLKSKKLNIEINPQFNNCFETDIRGHFRFQFIPGKVVWQAGKTYFKFRK